MTETRSFESFEFKRSPQRDAVIELLAKAPPDGTPIAAIMHIPNVGSRDAVDHLLNRMVKSYEIARVDRGRYVLRGPRAPIVRVPFPQTAAPQAAAVTHEVIPGEFGHPLDVAQPITPDRAPAPPPPVEPAAPPPPEPVRTAPVVRAVTPPLVEVKAPEIAPRPPHRRPADPFRRRPIDQLEVGAVDMPFRDDDRFGPRAPTVEPVEFDTFIGMIGNLGGKFRLCPPVEIRDAAVGWSADGIALAFCFVEFERALCQEAENCRSGATDRLLTWIDKLIRYEWNKAHPEAPVPKAHRPFIRVTKRVVEVERIRESDWIGGDP